VFKRNLMRKGTKFRETPNPNFEKIEVQIVDALEEYVQKWSNKERIDVEYFTSWKRKVIELVSNKLQQLKAKCRRYHQTGEILRKPVIKTALEDLHEKFIICVVDKASNNFAII
jgi:arginyl-tRNA synthetase